MCPWVGVSVLSKNHSIFLIDGWIGAKFSGPTLLIASIFWAGYLPSRGFGAEGSCCTFSESEQQGKQNVGSRIWDLAHGRRKRGRKMGLAGVWTKFWNFNILSHGSHGPPGSWEGWKSKVKIGTPTKSNSKNILFYSIFRFDAPLRPVKILNKGLQILSFTKWRARNFLRFVEYMQKKIPYGTGVIRFCLSVCPSVTSKKCHNFWPVGQIGAKFSGPHLTPCQ